MAYFVIGLALGLFIGEIAKSYVAGQRDYYKEKLDALRLIEFIRSKR